MASNLATRDSVPRDTPGTLPVKLGPQNMQPYAQRGPGTTNSTCTICTNMIGSSRSPPPVSRFPSAVGGRSHSYAEFTRPVIDGSRPYSTNAPPSGAESSPEPSLALSTWVSRVCVVIYGGKKSVVVCLPCGSCLYPASHSPKLEQSRQLSFLLLLLLW